MELNVSLPDAAFVASGGPKTEFQITSWHILSGPNGGKALASIGSKSFIKDGKYLYKVNNWFVTYEPVKDVYYLDMHCELAGESTVLGAKITAESLYKYSVVACILKAMKEISEMVESFTDLNIEETRKFVKGSFPEKMWALKPEDVSVSVDFQNTKHTKFDVSKAAYLLPAVSEEVLSPCDCENPNNKKLSVRTVIIHLNDHHRWAREKIADWLDELHDSGTINIEFQPWEEEVSNEESD